MGFGGERKREGNRGWRARKAGLFWLVLPKGEGRRAKERARTGLGVKKR